jgi:hypothetical protein
LRWPLAGVCFGCQAVVVFWASLAIYYSNLLWLWLRLGLALVFAAFSIWALLLARSRRTLLVFAALFLCVLGW